MIDDKVDKGIILLFDGVCIFCNSCVNFIIKHDKKNQFKFAAIQSEAGKELLKKFNIDSSIVDSIILLQNNKFYTKSSAALHIVKHLSGIFPLLFVFILVPPFIRNAVYDFIARNRYKWFGKKEVCMVPSAEIKSKFIS